jgi:hypothetical protein
MTAPEAPVEISAGGGVWRLLRHAPSRTLRAEYHPATIVTSPVWATVAGDSWRLEQRLSFVLPLAVHRHLTDADTDTAALPPRAADSPPPAGSRPARFDRVRVDGHDSSYGRLLHEAPPVHTWAADGFRIDIITVVDHARLDGRDIFALAYRLLHDDRVIAAGGDLPVTGDPIPRSVLVRYTADVIATTRAGEPDIGAWLERHGGPLRRLTALPAHPLPAGTAVTINVGAYREKTTGTVVRPVHDEHGQLQGYLTRPHVWDRPGHALRRQADRVLFSAPETVAPVLIPPDPAGHLAFGARVASIDHARVATGTLLRLLAKGNWLLCQIRPDGPNPTPVWLDHRNIELIAGALWPSVEALVDARYNAGLPIMPGERLLAAREQSTASIDRARTIWMTFPQPAGPPDPLLEPGVEQPAMTARTVSSTLTVGGYRLRPGTSPVETVLVEPDGAMTVVPAAAFMAGLRRPTADLARLLNEHTPGVSAPAALTGRPADRRAAHTIAAAITAVHVPIPLAEPSPDPPSTPGPDTPPAPDPPGL